MAPVTNSRIIFNSIPEGFPEPGKTTLFDTSKTIDLEDAPLNDGVLVKVLDLSIDPYMRNRLTPGGYELGQPIAGFGVGVVLRSENLEVKVGDHVTGVFPHQEYFISSNPGSLEVIQNPHKLPWSNFIAVLGMPGLSAFRGWREFARPKKGDIVFVSAGGGPVGSLVIQLAKLDGLKVIASAGSEEKLKYMKEVGADVVFNYKVTSTAEVLKKEGPIDIYWDNVGGETLDAALLEANMNARFIECGMISGYNTGGAVIRNLFKVVGKQISMNGFTYEPSKLRDEFKAWMPERVASGEIKSKEHVYNGLDKVGDVLLAVLKGDNQGKAVVHVADA